MGSSRSFKKRAVVIPVVIIGLAAAVYGLRGVIQTVALRTAMGVIAKTLEADIHYSRVQGNIFTGIALSEFSIRLQTGDSLRTEKLQLRYNLISFVQKRFFIPQVALTAPELFVAKERKVATGPVPKSFPTFSITEFVISNGRIHWGAETVDSLSGSIGIHSRSSRIDCAVRRFSFNFHGLRFGPIGSEVVIEPGAVDLARCTIMTHDSKLDLTGRADFKKKYYQVAIKEGTLSLEELTRRTFAGKIIVTGLFGMAGDSLFGALSCRTDAWSFRSTALPPLAGVVRGRGDFLDLTLTSRDTVFGAANGDVRANYKTKDYQGKIEFDGFDPAGLLAGGLFSKWKDRTTPVKLNGSVAVTGAGFDTIRLDCEFDRILIAGIDVDRISGTVEKSGDRYRIEKTSIRRGAMDVAINGEITKKNFRFACALEAVPLELVGKIAKIDLKGTVNGKGEIFTNGIAGSFLLTDGRWNRFSLSRAEVNLDIGDFKQLAGRADLKLENLIYQGRTLGAGKLELADRNFEGGFTAANSNLGLAGAVVLAQDGFEIQMAKLFFTSNGESLATTRQFTLAKHRGTVSLSHGSFTVAGGQLDVDATVQIGKRPRIALGLTNLSLVRLGRMLNIKNPPEGTVALAVEADTSYSAALVISRFHWADFRLAEVEGTITGDEKSIRIDHLNLVADSQAVKVAGSIGYNFDSKTNQFQWNDMNIECQMHNAGAWLFSPLKNIVDLKQGRINGTLTLQGNFKNPVFGGTVDIDRGTLSIPAIRFQGKDATLAFTLKNNKVILTSGKTRIDKSTLLGTGWIEFSGFVPQRLEFLLRGTDVPFNPKKEIYAVTSGELRLGWSLNGPLVLKGNMDIDQALLTYQFGSGTGMGGGKPQKNPPQFDITIRGDKGIWLRNNYVNVELSVDLQIKSEGGAMRFAGTLKTLRGAVYYLGQRLVITEGTITFVNLPELNPDLDIWAEYVTNEKEIVDNKPQALKIVLHVSGTLRLPQFVLSSDPPGLSETDIIAYLSLNRPLKDVTSGDFTDVMGDKLVSYFEQEVSKRVKQILPIDDVQISGSAGLFSSEPTRVTVGKYVSKNLYLTWTHNFTNVTQDVIEAQYSLGKNHALVGQKTEEGNYSFSYRFKFRY